MKTLDQRRAAHAWKTIDAIRSDVNRKDIVRAAKKLPVRIMTAGLGHALAFVAAKNKTKNKAIKLLESLSGWVLVEKTPTQPASAPNLLQAIINGNSDTLRRYSAETLA
jgi:CRISPR-associated protein Cmr5